MGTVILSGVYLGAVLAVAASMLFLALRARKGALLWWFFGCQGSVLFWCLSQIFILQSESTRQLWFSYVVGNLGVCLLGACFMGFCMSFSDKTEFISASWTAMALGLLQYILFLTNAHHHMYYVSFSIDRVEHGPLFYTNLGLIYVCVIVSILLLCLKRQADVKQKILLIASGLCPLLVSLLYQTGALRTESDVTALGFVGSIFFMLMATFRCNFLDVRAIATNKVLEGMDDGVATFDAYGCLMGENASFRRMSGELFGTEHFSDMDTLFAALPQEERERLLLGEPVTVGHVQIKCQKHMDRHGQHIGTTLLLKDVSEFYALLEKNRELAAASEQIAIEQERNRIAQEVHDTTGHTLTMIRSLIRLARISCEQGNMAEGLESMNQAEEMAQTGIRNLREEINHIRQEERCPLVTQALLQLANQVKELPVEVTVQGEDSEEYSPVAGILSSCLREAITNCLKYAHATRMDVIVKFREGRVELFIFDDGQGCDTVRDGNGLSGMRARVEQAGGTIRFRSGAGEGFQIVLEVPAEQRMSSDRQEP